MTTTPQASTATIPGLFTAAVAARPNEPALAAVAHGQLQWHAWGKLAAGVAAWKASLAALGVASGERVAQLSANCPGWIVADLAIQELGAVHVPLHASLAPEQAAEQVVHSEARLVLAANAQMADRLRPHLPAHVPVVLHEQLLVADAAANSPRTTVGPAPDDLATILYTSGTTGAPLGVMLSQRNLVANALAITQTAAPPGDELRLCLLPLSHIYARTCDLYIWLVNRSRLVLAESRETVFRDCGLVGPTAINAVPYFYQKVVDRLRAGGGEIDGAALRSALGGAIQRCYCGGASLPPEVDRFFAERDLPILCGYGLTEAAPVITATSPGGYRAGTVGQPLPDVEVRLTDDGEITVRGPNVMQGYWRNEVATSRVLRDGWLATGDLGEWDAARPGESPAETGHLRIVGRKKEMLVLATGKKVAPTRVEERLAGSPWIEQACVVGDGRKCLAALIVPNGEALRQEVKRRRLLVWSRRRALTHPQVLALYRGEIDRCLSGLAEFEQVGAFTLMGRSFALDRGEVTPKQSLCRSVIQRTFADEIEAMYRRMT
jgi:long-chain acyl-CoA synthetase